MTRPTSPLLVNLFLLLATCIPFVLSGQHSSIPAEAISNLTFRNVGPTRGGRVTTVAGHVTMPNTFYMGATGGGVWKTENFGHTWRNISDGFFATGSIGSICVAPSDAKILYVGTGSDGLRSNVIIGKGMYKSIDAGEKWIPLGLEDVGQIGSVIVHPMNPDVVYVAAIGNPFKKSNKRGIYRSTDGGTTWEHTFFHSDSVGAVDLEFAPDNPELIYASVWRAERKPWTIISGAHQVGGLYKSVDAGSNWIKLKNGLPTGLIGKSDLAVSPADPKRVWALIEAPQGEGGVFRSDDLGKTFTLVNTKKDLLDRPFYYCNIDVNPLNSNTLYINSTRFWHSTDGGAKWNSKGTPHGDNHDMWINPLDSNLFIQSNDGGANVTRDGGATWSSIQNQPTAELYQVAVDDQSPYWLYAGQQDNSTIAVPSLPPYASPAGATAYWLSVGGCETGPAIPKPGNSNIVYANCKGRFGVYNKLTGQEKKYYVGATNIYGHSPTDLKFRFQRVSPIHISPHNSDLVYHASQYLHQTTDDGKTWEVISPDLTAFTPETQVISGTPITRDVTGEEYYSTIYAVQESPLKAGVIWVGANDGPVHLTQDGGQHWVNVTPKDMPASGRVQSIEASPHDAAKAYISVYRYLLGDFTPYIYRTNDYGKNWTLLTKGDNGIPSDHPTRVIREDPEVEGLLYTGTEFGLYFSANDGQSWQTLQQNLPVTPITDIKLVHNDLILSTMGRSFWIMDDVSALRQTIAMDPQENKLLNPADAIRMRYQSSESIPNYPSSGVIIDYFLTEGLTNDVELKIHNLDGKLIRTYNSKREINEEKKEPDMATGFGSDSPAVKISKVKGSHRMLWDLRYDGISSKSGRKIPGPMVAPGKYRIDLSIGAQTIVTHANVLIDPRIEKDKVTQADLEAQEHLALDVLALSKGAMELAEIIDEKIDAIGEDVLIPEHLSNLQNSLSTAQGRYQTPMLIDQLSYLYNMLNRADQRPGQDAYERYAELKNWFENLREKADSEGLTD